MMGRPHPQRHPGSPIRTSVLRSTAVSGAAQGIGQGAPGRRTGVAALALPTLALSALALALALAVAVARGLLRPAAVATADLVLQAQGQRDPLARDIHVQHLDLDDVAGFDH